MEKEKQKKESRPVDGNNFTEPSTGMDRKTQQQKTTQKSAQFNEPEGMK